MGYPKEKEIAKVMKKLKNVEPTTIIGKDAPAVDQLKFALCKEMLIYLRTKGITQLQLAKELNIDPARISEIVKYKIDLFTADRLLELVEKIKPKVKVTVA